MQVIKCELCGSGELIKKDGFFVCVHCGTKYTLEEARKLLGTVKIDKTDETENLKLLARRFMNEGDYLKASEYYEKALENNANDAESIFYRSYCLTIISQLGNIPQAMNGFSNAVMMTYDLFRNNPEDVEIHEALWNETIDRIEGVLTGKADSLVKYYKQNRGSREAVVENTVADNMHPIGMVYSRLETYFKNAYPDKKHWISRVQSMYLKFIDEYGSYCFERSFIHTERKRLKKELGLIR